jgi:hypothetical protein
MDLDWIVLGAAYVLFLILSRGVLGGASKAVRDWGGANAARVRRMKASS